MLAQPFNDKIVVFMSRPLFLDYLFETGSLKPLRIKKTIFVLRVCLVNWCSQWLLPPATAIVQGLLPPPAPL